MSNRDKIDALASSELVSSATLAALVKSLLVNGILSNDDVRELYEDALLILESQQGDNAHTRKLYEDARAVIESQMGDFDVPDEPEGSA